MGNADIVGAAWPVDEAELPEPAGAAPNGVVPLPAGLRGGTGAIRPPAPPAGGAVRDRIRSMTVSTFSPGAITSTRCEASSRAERWVAGADAAGGGVLELAAGGGSFSWAGSAAERWPLAD